MGRRYGGFWADFLGIEPRDWDTAGISFRPHVGLVGYRGFWCFRRNQRLVVSAPLQWLAKLESTFAGWHPDRLMDPLAVTAALGSDVERFVGPAFQGFLTHEDVAPVSTPQVRKLEPSDEPAVEWFKRSCGVERWNESGLDEADGWRCAHFEYGQVVAMAGYRSWREDVGDPCVLTHPEFRHRRHGASVARAVVSHARQHGKLMLYQTLESNHAAVRLALSVGYEKYANHIAIRLSADK